MGPGARPPAARSSGEPTVEVLDRDGVRHVTIRRPPVNALSGREYTAIRSAFTPSAGMRVCVLRGSGRIFCSGQDVGEAGRFNRDRFGAHMADAGAAVAAVARSPVPLVTVVNGPAVGAGALLAALGDVVVMADSAWLSVPEAHHGLPLGFSLLSRFVPARVARRLLATGGRISARQLAALGAADRVVPVDRLDDALGEVLGELAGLPPRMATWLFTPEERDARARDYLEELAATIAAGTWRF